MSSDSPKLMYAGWFAPLSTPPPSAVAGEFFRDHTETTPATLVTTEAAQHHVMSKSAPRLPARSFRRKGHLAQRGSDLLASSPCPLLSSSPDPEPETECLGRQLRDDGFDVLGAARQEPLELADSARPGYQRRQTHAARALAGRAPLPLCGSCRWPERAAREDASCSLRRVARSRAREFRCRRRRCARLTITFDFSRYPPGYLPFALSRHPGSVTHVVANRLGGGSKMRPGDSNLRPTD